MKKILVFLGVILLLWSGPAFAYPVLQLDIAGGSYYGGPSGTYDTETIIYTGTDGIFTVHALLTPKNNINFGNYIKNGSDNDAYLSVALYPKVSGAADLGSFTVNGVIYDVTDDMTYGTPSVETNDPDNPEWDLQSHGVFQTYYTQIGFDWDSNLTSVSYNSQDNPGDLTPDAGGETYYIAFNVDASGLSYLNSLHFDLYSADLDGDTKMDYVAPFSHDAQSTPVPEPATMLLLGTGLIGMAGIGRKKFKK